MPKTTRDAAARRLCEAQEQLAYAQQQVVITQRRVDDAKQNWIDSTPSKPTPTSPA
ncbi:MAG: hypothetical protein V3R78_12570 [Thermodesulfobacteriota bacterium]